MRSRIRNTVAIVTTVSAVALTTASVGLAGPAQWCPQSGGLCQEAGARTRVEPAQSRPKAVPFRSHDRNGQEVFRSGGWIMY